MNSFKCGTHVSIQFCDDDDSCHKEEFAESAAGDSENQRMGERNLHSFAILTPYDPSKRIAATVFDGDYCNGWSHVVWIEEGKDTSGDAYANVGESLPSLGNDKIKSVMMPEQGDSWMDMWDGDQFEVDAGYSWLPIEWR